MDKQKKKKISRYSLLMAVMFTISIVIIIRLVYLQVYKNGEYEDKANVASRHFVEEKAPRGKIYDSKGNVLATSIETYNVTFSDTKNSKVSFYSTMNSIFKILDNNEEKQKDEFKLQYSKDKGYYFEFNVNSEKTKKALELSFKRDRGITDFIKGKLFPDNDSGDLNEQQQKQVDEEAAKVTPEQCFDYLLCTYSMYSDLSNLSKSQSAEFSNKVSSAKSVKEALNIYTEAAKQLKLKYSADKLRRYMVVKDALKMQSFTSYNPINIAENIKKDTAFIIYEKLVNLPGVDVELEPVRTYPNKTLACSVLGYLSSIDSSKKEKYEEQGYDISTDKIGVSGIEAAFEKYLKGTKGGKTIKVNSQGRQTEELSQLEVQPGNNVHLTIDAELQAVAERALKGQLEELQKYPDTKNATRGAVVVQEVATGRILALANYPNYDPNTFSIPGLLTDAKIKEYFTPDYESFANAYIARNGLNKTYDDLFPKKSDGSRNDQYEIYPKIMYNYATEGLMPPGSTFKPFTSLVGLQQGVISPTSMITDYGVFNKYPEVSGIDKGFAPLCEKYMLHQGTHGTINVSDALKYSCNYFFYETAYRLWKQAGGGVKGLNAFASYAEKVGLGYDIKNKEKATTGIEISEKFGNAYNFDSFKENLCLYAKFDLVSALEKGQYGQYNFVPFDIGNKDTDSEELKKAKNNVKDMVINRIRQQGTSANALGYNEFVKSLKEPLTKVASLSDVYKEEIKKRSTSVNSQIEIVAEALGQFTIYDKGRAVTTPAEIINASIGQGTNQFTPLQLAGYISTIVNGGTRYKAHLVDKITDADGNTVDEYKPEVLSKIDISSQNLNAIKVGMNAVNEASGGTAASHWAGFPIKTGGKTGTASYTSDPKVQASVGRAAYGVYVSFAPLDNPKIAVAAVIYDGYEGNKAAPIVRAIYENYFKDELKKQNYKPKFSYAFDTTVAKEK